MINNKKIHKQDDLKSSKYLEQERIITERYILPVKINNQSPLVKGTCYVWIAFTALVAAMILLIPEEWLEIEEVYKVLTVITHDNDRIKYLARLSDYPKLVFAGYGIVLYSAPIHTLLSSMVIISRYRSGLIKQSVLYKGAFSFWIGPLAFYHLFLSCIFCWDNPDWRDYSLASGRYMIATFVQGGVFLAVVPFGTSIAALLQLKNSLTKSANRSNPADGN